MMEYSVETIHHGRLLALFAVDSAVLVGLSQLHQLERWSSLAFPFFQEVRS